MYSFRCNSEIKYFRIYVNVDFAHIIQLHPIYYFISDPSFTVISSNEALGRNIKAEALM
jgi:hypothetical protein